MSSENNYFDVEEPVLRHRSLGSSITLSRAVSPEDLAFDWTLSDRDKLFVLEHRGAKNICRFAVALCVFRKHGRFLSDYSSISPSILGYLCQQLDIEPMMLLDGSFRRNTESSYHQKITAYLQWKPFDEQARKILYQWIGAQVSEQLYVEELISKSEAFLRQLKIVIPGPTVLEREVNAACSLAEKELWKKLADQIPQAVRNAIDRYLGVLCETPPKVPLGAHILT